MIVVVATYGAIRRESAIYYKMGPNIFTPLTLDQEVPGSARGMRSIPTDESRRLELILVGQPRKSKGHSGLSMPGTRGEDGQSKVPAFTERNTDCHRGAG